MEKDSVLFKLVTAALFISSFSFTGVAFSGEKGDTAGNVIFYISEVLFWLFLVAGYVIFRKISKHRKKYKKSMKYTKGHMRESNRPGAFCFFSNIHAVIADIVMVLSFVITLIFVFIPSLNQNVAVFFVALLIFSVHMHCILNGVNFRYIKSLNKQGE